MQAPRDDGTSPDAHAVCSTTHGEHAIACNALHPVIQQLCASLPAREPLVASAVQYAVVLLCTMPCSEHGVHAVAVS